MDVYDVYTQLKQLFGTQLHDLSLTFYQEKYPPNFSLGFNHQSPIMKPSIEPRFVKEWIEDVDKQKNVLLLPDTSWLLKQVLLYK